MTYAKGVYYERDLLKFLSTRGFSTLRVAGSGHNSPADIVAIKKGIILVIECKAHVIKPKIQKDRVQEMKVWCEQAGALGFLAWRAPQQEWLFLSLKNLEENQYADEHWVKKDQFLQTFM